MDLNYIKFRDYKCFKEAKIDNIKPINIIIGKNNIGKSSILDIIEMVYSNAKIRQNNITLEKNLTQQDIIQVFHENVHSSDLPGFNNYDFGKKFIGKQFPFDIYLNGNNISNRSSVDLSKYSDIYEEKYNAWWSRLATSMKYDKKIVKRILAERNIFPEIENEDMSVDGNGNGITTVITNYINKDGYMEEMVKEKLLNKLNEIMGEDATFTEILTQQVKHDDINKWEIFLREEEKGRIALSNSGSGLKTILMVLVYTILIPNIEQKNICDYIFMFEELENNLHPSLQRRLLKYIEELSLEKCVFFLTTHSNIVLDTFQNSDNVNMIHVIKNKENKNVEVLNVTNSIQANVILDDLGIKASDIFQSNGVIWVEGPSDRIYINKWIELWSNGKLKEGKDYQCVFYGGRLLSHLTLAEQEENNLIELLKVNRNSIIVIDSDKHCQQSRINDTKRRIQEEAKQIGMVCWITKGREIENYLSSDLIINKLELRNENYDFGQYQNVEEFLDTFDKGLGNKFLRDKVSYAKRFITDVQLNDYNNNLDLDERMKEVVKTIEHWNSND